MHSVSRVCTLELSDADVTFTFHNYGGSMVNVWRAYGDSAPKEIDVYNDGSLSNCTDEHYAQSCADWLISHSLDTFADAYDGSDRLSIWLDDSTAVHVERTAETDERGAARYAYEVDHNGETIMQGNDLCCFTESLYRAMSTLVTFLTSYAESVDHAHRHSSGTPDDMAPDALTFGQLVTDGAIDLDELSMWAYDTDAIMDALDLR